MTSQRDKDVDILKNAQSIALVGVSPRTDAQSYAVASYLQSQGYKLVPVTSHDKTVLGFPTNPNLQSVSNPVDVMVVFEETNETDVLASEINRLGVKGVWVEPGCSSRIQEACQKTSAAIHINHSIMNDHKQLLEHSDL